jgi:hypothetical protein
MGLPAAQSRKSLTSGLLARVYRQARLVGDLTGSTDNESAHTDEAIVSELGSRT